VIADAHQQTQEKGDSGSPAAHGEIHDLFDRRHSAAKFRYQFWPEQDIRLRWVFAVSGEEFNVRVGLFFGAPGAVDALDQGKQLLA
jgi:hypothetical protein